MKKGWLLFNLIFLGAILLACDKPVVVERNTHSIYTMDTEVIIDLTYSPVENKKNHYMAIEEIYDTYSKVSDNFRTYPNITNVYTINQKTVLSEVSETFEISKELYELIDFAYDIQLNSNGYFDISIGKIIDVWKELIEKYQMGIDMDLEEEVELAIKVVEKIEIIEEPLNLFIEENKYYITVKPGVKIDLGAIAKGYATQKATEYLLSQGIINYIINGGSSSMMLGLKTQDTPNYNIGLINPVNRYTNYGIVRANNVSITSSGSNIQKFETKDGTWYHHIISPKTKKPEHFYYSISLLGQDAGLLDAYSTALFSMPLDEVKNFLKDKDIEFIAFDINEEIKIINPSGRFQQIGK